MDMPETETDEQVVAATQEDVPASHDIEKTLRDLFPPLHGHQREGLRHMIEAGEVTPRVIVWAETGVVVDGRETKRICDDLQVAYETEERNFIDLEAVVCWRIAGQLRHRNLTPLACSYYRGRHYLGLKRQGHRSDLTFRQNGERRTDELLGRLYGVGARTISRDAKLCEALDSIAEKQAEPLDPLFPDGFVLNTRYRSSVLSGRIRPTRGEILTMARMRPGEMARAIKDMLEAKKEARRKKTAPEPTPDVPPTPAPLPPQDAVQGPKPDELPVPAVPADGLPGHAVGTPPVAISPTVSATTNRCEGNDAHADAPASRAEPEDAPEAINEAGLKDINILWNRLTPATQLAFLTQDDVSKRICEAGFFRTVYPCTAGGAA